ncbi:MAG: hypothetical protein FJ264_15610 [Planctomycetes bacterium]|nr:hypothetical protein [Planctomycetota bacterium]
MIRNRKHLHSDKTFKVSPTNPAPTQVEMINQFTRRKFTAEEIYIGQLRLAHNAIDRDEERFSEEVLERFKETIVRRTMLFDHAKYDSKTNAIGKFFDVEYETMPIEQAREILGEDIQLPKGVAEVKILAPWFYIPVEGIDKQLLVKIDAGIYEYASIGFRAESRVPVTDKNGNILYHEYRGTGKNTEALEGSLVYLGAQPGMGVKSNSSQINFTSLNDDINLLVPGDDRKFSSRASDNEDDLLIPG